MSMYMGDHAQQQSVFVVRHEVDTHLAVMSPSGDRASTFPTQIRLACRGPDAHRIIVEADRVQLLLSHMV